MYAVLLAIALVAADDKPKAPPAGDDKPAMAASLDGNWMVVCAEKNGQPVADAKNMTVAIKGNVVTCNAPAGSTDKAMKAMRLTFGPNATIRVTEANADGKFNDTTPDQTPADGTKPDANKGTKSGVYVLTSEYLAICIHEENANSGIRQVGGTDPATTPPGEKPAVGTERSEANGKPNGKSYCTMILKRSDAK